MARIAGVDLPGNKKVEISLTYIYGIGQALSKKILEELKIDPNKKASDLPAKEVNDLKDYIEKKYKELSKDLDEDKKQRVDELLKESEKDPEVLTKKISEILGFEIYE